MLAFQAVRTDEAKQEVREPRTLDILYSVSRLKIEVFPFPYRLLYIRCSSIRDYCPPQIGPQSIDLVSQMRRLTNPQTGKERKYTEWEVFGLCQERHSSQDWPKLQRIIDQTISGLPRRVALRAGQAMPSVPILIPAREPSRELAAATALTCQNSAKAFPADLRLRSKLRPLRSQAV